MHAVVNNDSVPVSKALLHVSDLAVQRGYGVFDFFKIQDGHAYFINEYLDRFYRSAGIMRLPVPLERDKIIQIVYRLIEKNALKESGIKMVLTGGYSPDGYQPGEPNLIMTHHPLSLPGEEQLRNGVKIITYDYVREIPEAKTINYTMGIWLSQDIKNAGAADVLYHKNGVVSEFPRCNFFIVRSDDTVVTPKQNVLHGITRKHVLELANRNYKAEENTLSLADVYEAREAFLTSTTKRIVPITQIDDKVIGNGKPGHVTHDLLEKLILLENEDQAKNGYPKKFYGF
jgi:branched-chain amino acid aminotransferase